MTIESRPGEFAKLNNNAEETITRAHEYQEQLDLLSGDDAKQYINDAVVELNHSFPLIRKDVFILGDGLAQDKSKKSFIGTELTLQENISAYGEHQGFEVRIYVDQNGNPRQEFMHRIIERIYQEKKDTNLKLFSERNSFFRLNSKYLATEPVDTLFPDVKLRSFDEQATRISNLQQYADIFSRISKSKKFNSLTANQQQKKLDLLIEKAEHVFGLRGVRIGGFATEVYADDPLEVYNFFKITGDDLEITGRCIALDSFVNLRPKNSKSELAQGQTVDRVSLCLVIEPDYDTINYLNIGKFNILYVPVTSFDIVDADIT